MSRGPLYLDRSPAMLLAVCTACRPPWRTPAVDNSDAARLLATHADRCHAGKLSHIASNFSDLVRHSESREKG